MNVAAYNKLVGGIIGAIAGFAVTELGVPVVFEDPSVIDWLSEYVIAGFTLIGVERAQPNRPA